MYSPRLRDTFYQSLRRALVNADMHHRSEVFAVYRNLNRNPMLYETGDCIAMAYNELTFAEFLDFLIDFAQSLKSVSRGELYDYRRDM